MLIYYLCRHSTHFTVLQMQFAKLFHSSLCSCMIKYFDFPLFSLLNKLSLILFNKYYKVWLLQKKKKIISKRKKKKKISLSVFRLTDRNITPNTMRITVLSIQFWPKKSVNKHQCSLLHCREYLENKFQVQRMIPLKAPVWGGYRCFLTHTQWILFSLFLHKSFSISWFDQIYERWTVSLKAPSTISVKLLCLFISQFLICKITVLFPERNVASSQEDTHWLQTAWYSSLSCNNADTSQSVLLFPS